MRLVDPHRWLKIQVIRLYNEGLTANEIKSYLNRVNPNKYKLSNTVKF